jgi:hypothetical protein
VGSYYLNIGNNQANGEFTEWSISGPLYQNYMALGNEIGTHSWTHPDDTSLLTPAELEFQFNQSALEIGTQLGIQVVGAAVPGNPENLNVVQQMNQWLPYMSGRYGGVGSGYPGAVGFLSPEHQMLYFSLNMLPDFTLIGFQQLTSAAAEQIWRDEMDALRRHASQPIIHWLWHDYGPTIKAINGYGVAMYENTIAYAFNGGTEFATLANMQSRIRAFQQATLDVNSANGLTANVIAGAVGQFSLKVHSAQVIASVTGWYAYDDDQVFLPEGGGQFAIQLGGSADALTRITALPMRARLLSVTGDGSELTFSFEGEGAVTARLHPSLLIHPQVTGADNFSHNGDTLTMQFNSFGIHNVTISNGNQTPTAQAQSLTTVRDASLAIALTGSDPDGDALTFAVVSGPAHGSLSGTAPALTYTPAAGYVGVDSFSFVVNDGTANSLEATIMLTVQAFNDANGLVLDGDLSDWANLVSFGADPDDVSGTNNLIDWREVWMAHDANDFYLAYRNDNPVTLSWGFAAFIDTDGNTATGFSMNFPIGADYLLQGDRLYQHNGGGTDWNWSLVGTAASSGEGDSVELMFPRSLLGNPTVLHLFFLSDSVAFGGMAWDAYPDAAVDPDAPALSRSFQYITNSE